MEKVYHKTATIDGTLHIQANTTLHVSNITIKAIQLLRVSRKEKEATILGAKTRRKQFVLPPLKRHELPFELSVTFPAATKREHKTYKGDLWPLNKAMDKAKKNLYSYLIQAVVKLKGKKDELIHEEEIKVEG